MLSNFLHYTDIQPLKQSDPTGEALLEVNLTTHGTLRDGCYLFIHAMLAGKLIDNFCLDKC